MKRKSKKSKRNRSHLVRRWTIAAAGGKCEMCGSAPFIRHDGEVYLEVHHVIPVHAGGDDVVTNTIAVCPNCHRAMHHARNRGELTAMAYERVPRLSKLSVGEMYQNHLLGTDAIATGDVSPAVEHAASLLAGAIRREGSVSKTWLARNVRSVKSKVRKQALEWMILSEVITTSLEESTGGRRCTVYTWNGE